MLGIKRSAFDIQKFIYWNFLKCFWKEDWGFDLSKIKNYNWYGPSNANRYTKSEFMSMAIDNQIKISVLHEEEAFYSSRFMKSREL